MIAAADVGLLRPGGVEYIYKCGLDLPPQISLHAWREKLYSTASAKASPGTLALSDYKWALLLFIDPKRKIKTCRCLQKVDRKRLSTPKIFHTFKYM